MALYGLRREDMANMEHLPTVEILNDCVLEHNTSFQVLPPISLDHLVVVSCKNLPKRLPPSCGSVDWVKVNP